MIVRMALVAMGRAVAVGMVVMAMAVVVMGMIVAAAAAIAMGVVMIMRVGVLMPMLMVVVVVTVVGMVMAVMVAMVVIVPVIVMPAATIIAVVMDFRLRLERALDRHHGAALPAHQLGDGRNVNDVERIGRHLGRDMVAAEMPGEAHQPQRVFGADLQQVLGRSLDLDQAAILQLQRIAIVQHGGLVEIDGELQPARRLHRQGAAAAILVPEAERIDDALGTDGGLANDGGGAKHVR